MSNVEFTRAERLDSVVVAQFSLITRSFATKLIKDGRVTVNGVAETKAGYKLREKDVVVVDYDASTETPPPDIDLPILYEDDDCVVINKPVGLLTHSKGAYNPEATVATWLRSKVNHMEGERAGIVHRLDRATSGVMICAKTPEALSWLQKQFSQRRVKKQYAAVITGHLSPEHAIIDLPIERNPKAPQTFRVGSNGKSATTEYVVLASSDTESLVELRPQTGRTHQLRVHMQYLKTPIVGDPLYDGAPADRLYLHAESLELTLPSRQRKVFTVPKPPEFLERVHA